MPLKERKVFVVGHKNPDTDSICSAIAYAELKNRIRERDESIPSSKKYLAVRCGHVN